MCQRVTLTIAPLFLLITAAMSPAADQKAGGDPPAADAAQPSSEDVVFREGLVIAPMGRYGRSAVHSDPLEYLFATGCLETPSENAPLSSRAGDGDKRWTKLVAGEDGWFRDDALAGGYLYAAFESDVDRVMVLEASGHSSVLVNGSFRAGDQYGYGWVRHPVQIQKGLNEFFFRVSRGGVAARLAEPAGPARLVDSDMTLPDLVLWEDAVVWGAVRVINASCDELRGYAIRCMVAGGRPVVSELPVVGPLTSRKIGFRIAAPVPEEEGTLSCRLALLRPAAGGGEPVELDALSIDLNVRSAFAHHNRTFVSSIDGSVQYFGVSPGRIEGDERPALVLTCHGASVEAAGQARCYAPKSWAHVVAPTNRRPYGFDWEDWGRLDALEVLDNAEKLYKTDPRRTYLTGHSMGGHGAWYLGATYPARFAAIGPSAGWYSFWSYGGKDRDAEASPIEQLFARASNPSDTIGLLRNYLHHGVYVLHGSADDNVPVEQARFMRGRLAEFHADFAYFEQPGAGHWWGNQCCDWPPLFEFFRQHTIPDDRDAAEVEFWTANPGVSARSRWATIEAQQRALDMSWIRIKQDVAARSFAGQTENVARLVLDLDQLDPGGTVAVDLDGVELKDIATPEGTADLRLVRENGAWRAAAPGEADASLKGPHRYGTFKDAFRHRVLFVYGTAGSAEENAWSYGKARYDAETFWYRGNGSIDVIADRDFDPAAEPDRSVIVYGNAATNAAWNALLKESPVQVEPGRIVVGSRELSGDDLGCYFVRPRPNSGVASVGVVGGTALAGMRAANANMYFISGSGFPDVLVFGADMLKDHFAGVRLAGYFGMDWSLETGELAWRE